MGFSRPHFITGINGRFLIFVQSSNEFLVILYQGGCTLRLCEEERVFVGRTGLCHDVNDPLECQGGRRLYYTAYGDPICDCPIGQYPFPDSTKDDCVSLFSRGNTKYYQYESILP